MNLLLYIQPCAVGLKGYGGQQLTNLETTTFNVSYKDKSVSTRFKKLKEVTRSSTTPTATKVQETAHEGNLSKETVLKQRGNCFDKLGRFPKHKYHMTLNEKATPIIHAPRTVPMHIFLIYKLHLQKMLADDVVTEVTMPNHWLISIGLLSDTTVTLQWRI